MSDLTRRQLLHRLALTIATAGAVDRAAAQEVHHLIAQAVAADGGYTPRSLSPREFRTLERLTDLIIPAEEDRPGAVQARVAAWIDTLLEVNDELKARYTTGLAWLDTAMSARGATGFLDASAAAQAELLDAIAYQRNRSPELNPGIDFFLLARRMTADGFYTSAIGCREVYLGNSPQATFTVPAASMEHVLSRSPLK